MLRTFVEHEARIAEPLDGVWDFVTASERTGRMKLPSKYTRSIYVPSAWEMLPGLENYRGKAWLRKSIFGHGDLAVRAVFGGVSHTAAVYVDGKRVGGHYDAFTPWDVVVGGLAEGEHELVVEVDNSFGPHSALHKENDYYTYGGITRPVEVQYVPDLHIDKVFATPVRKGGRWSLDVRVRLKNCGRSSARRGVVVFLSDCDLDLGEVTVRAGAAKQLGGTLTGLDVKPWTESTPELYSLTAVLLDGAETTDDLTDRVGFREVKVRGKKLLLNGCPIRLRGYNRHEDHPRFGCALPVEAMAADLAIMRDLGCNFVRTCHYPNDMRFLDLCDEMGFYVWEESHARAVNFGHPEFREQIAASTEEMVTWHHNRPSIVMWGCLNECDSVSASGRREHARVLKLLKRLDRSRPVTFASNKGDKDACLDLVDIVSWNRYDAWYGGCPEEVEPRLEKALKWLHSPASGGGAGKPVILSEFGAGAIYGNRQACRSKWSEEYQSDVLDESLRVYLAHPDVVGAAIWQFCDVRITQDCWRNRPRTMNNKGTVDEYRRAKLAYEVVKRRMHEAKDAPGR